MKIKIYIATEKTKKTPEFYRKAIQEYEKRLQRYCKVNIIWLKKTTNFPKKQSVQAHVTWMNTQGSNDTSEAFATHLSNVEMEGKELIFWVSDVTPPIEYEHQLTVSTLEHDQALTATLLIEQIYRAFRIIHNHPYHK